MKESLRYENDDDDDDDDFVLVEGRRLEYQYVKVRGF